MPGVPVAAPKAAGAFARRREKPDPKAVAGPRVDLDEPLADSTFKEPTRRKKSRTTNAIERRSGEAGPLRVFADRSSIERIHFAVFNHEIHEPGGQRLFPAGTERVALPNAGGLPPAAIAVGVSGRRFSYAVPASRIKHIWL